MIQQESRLKVADNSGAKEVLCIRVLYNQTTLCQSRRYLCGDCQASRSKWSSQEKVSREGCRCSHQEHRPNALMAARSAFDENACVIVNDDKTPKANSRVRSNPTRTARSWLCQNRQLSTGGTIMKRIRKDDQVKVIAGGNKGKIAKVARVDGDQVYLEGVGTRTRHVAANRINPQGGSIQLPVHISNAALVVEDVKNARKTSKVSYQGQRRCQSPGSEN